MGKVNTEQKNFFLFIYKYKSILNIFNYFSMQVSLIHVSMILLFQRILYLLI